MGMAGPTDRELVVEVIIQNAHWLGGSGDGEQMWGGELEDGRPIILIINDKPKDATPNP
jgi:hypothetical protein